MHGNAFLRVSISPAVAHTFEGDQRRETIQDRDQRPGLPRVRHLKETCDHHGGVGWVIGLDERQPYRVLELREPQRIVIDVRHNGR